MTAPELAAPAVGDEVWVRVRTRWRMARVVELHRSRVSVRLLRPIGSHSTGGAGCGCRTCAYPVRLHWVPALVSRERPDVELGAEWLR